MFPFLSSIPVDVFDLPWSEVVYRSDRAEESAEREKGSKVKKLSTVVEVG